MSLITALRNVGLLGGLLIASNLPVHAVTYTTHGNQMLKDGVAHEWRGVNAMSEFGSDGSNMKDWPTIDIVRETMLHMASQPIDGPSVVIEGKAIQSLQSIVNHNRSRGQITLFSAHAWGSPKEAFQSRNPQETPWWEEYKVRYRAIAEHFKTQPDVWFGIWNEPYSWQGARGYSDELWLRDMTAMVDNIRSTGAQNIIVVPCSHNGQKEDVLLSQGPKLLKDHNNIVFEIHAYERWIGRPNDELWTVPTQAEIETRIQALKTAQLPIIFGEYGTYNNRWLASAEPFLKACRKQSVGALAWTWQVGGSDENALRRADGSPNDSEENHHYASLVKAYLSEPRVLPPAP